MGRTINGHALRQARTARRLSQHALAVAAGTTGMTVYRLEKGRIQEPSEATVERLADALGVTADSLLVADEEVPA